MDTLDISKLSKDTKVIATVEELKRLYSYGWSAGHNGFDIKDGYQIIRGDIA